MQRKKTASVKTAVKKRTNGNGPDKKKTSASRVVHTPIGVCTKTGKHGILLQEVTSSVKLI